METAAWSRQQQDRCAVVRHEHRALHRYYRVCKRARNHDQDVLKANDGHPYLNKHGGPLHDPAFEGVEACVPGSAETLLTQEHDGLS